MTIKSCCPSDLCQACCARYGGRLQLGKTIYMAASRYLTWMTGPVDHPPYRRHMRVPDSTLSRFRIFGTGLLLVSSGLVLLLFASTRRVRLAFVAYFICSGPSKLPNLPDVQSHRFHILSEWIISCGFRGCVTNYLTLAARPSVLADPVEGADHRMDPQQQGRHIFGHSQSQSTIRDSLPPPPYTVHAPPPPIFPSISQSHPPSSTAYIPQQSPTDEPSRNITYPRFLTGDTLERPMFPTNVSHTQMGPAINGRHEHGSPWSASADTRGERHDSRNTEGELLYCLLSLRLDVLRQYQAEHCASTP